MYKTLVATFRAPEFNSIIHVSEFTQSSELGRFDVREFGGLIYHDRGLHNREASRNMTQG